MAITKPTNSRDKKGFTNQRSSYGSISRESNLLSTSSYYPHSFHSQIIRWLGRVGKFPFPNAIKRLKTLQSPIMLPTTFVAVILLTLSVLQIASSTHETTPAPTYNWQQPSLCRSDTSYPTSQLYDLWMTVYNRSRAFKYSRKRSDGKVLVLLYQ